MADPDQLPVDFGFTQRQPGTISAALLTAGRSTSFYDLRNTGYDCEAIRIHSRSLGHVPIIPHQKHGTVRWKWRRMKGPLRERTTAERVYSRPEGGVRRTLVRVTRRAK